MVQRSNKHVWVGLGFVAFAIVVAGALYAGMRIGSNQSGTSSATSEQATLSPAATNGEQVADNDNSPAAQAPKSKIPLAADIIKILAPGIAMSTSASSGQAFCNGPETFSFDPVGSDGVRSVTISKAESDVWREGNYSVRDGQIRITNVEAVENDIDTGEAVRTPAPSITLTVTAADPQGYEGRELTVKGKGVLFGCRESD